MGKLFDTKSRRDIQHDALVNFEYQTTRLFEEFVRKYYGKKAEWVYVFQNDVNTIYIETEYVTIETAYEVMKYKLTRKQYFDFLNQLVKKEHPYRTVASYVHYVIRKIR